jgi:uncharacterized protein YjbI with pentapeptide repeats
MTAGSPGICFSGTRLHGATLQGASLRRVDLGSAALHSASLARRATEAIAEGSHRRLKEVAVKEEDTAIVVSGTAPSYYAAQLALAAVRGVMRELADSRVLRSAITVRT